MRRGERGEGSEDSEEATVVVEEEAVEEVAKEVEVWVAARAGRCARCGARRSCRGRHYRGFFPTRHIAEGYDGRDRRRARGWSRGGGGHNVCADVHSERMCDRTRRVNSFHELLMLHAVVTRSVILR